MTHRNGPALSSELRDLERALLADAEADVGEALKVAVCVSYGLSRPETASKLQIGLPRVKVAIERLRRASDRLGWSPGQF